MPDPEDTNTWPPSRCGPVPATPRTQHCSRHRPAPHRPAAHEPSPHGPRAPPGADRGRAAGRRPADPRHRRGDARAAHRRPRRGRTPAGVRPRATPPSWSCGPAATPGARDGIPATSIAPAPSAECAPPRCAGSRTGSCTSRGNCPATASADDAAELLVTRHGPATACSTGCGPARPPVPCCWPPPGSGWPPPR